jgi:hypothetical protein
MALELGEEFVLARSVFALNGANEWVKRGRQKCTALLSRAGIDEGEVAEFPMGWVCLLTARE